MYPVLVLVLASIYRLEGAIPPVINGSKLWNINGDVLVLDVSSLKYQGNHPFRPTIGTPDTCQAYCMQVQGCSGWTFCSNEDGCGSGCDQYMASNEPLTHVYLGGDPSIPNKEWYQLTSIKSFGPWGPTAHCKSVCGWSGPNNTFSCKPTPKWPYGMCSLKVLKDPAKPEYYSQNQGEGWVSGWVKVPSQCSGISARACQRCRLSRDPDKCVACAKNSKLKISLLEAVRAGTSELKVQDGCAACYTTNEPEKCTDCLFNNKPCAACALQDTESPQKVDVLKCINCNAKYGPRYTDTCVNCAVLAAQTGAVDRCLSCVDRASKVACNKTDWPVTCYNPESATSVCATCSTAAKDYETCVKCLERMPYSESCSTCARLDTADKQKKCYDCIKTAPSPVEACYDCLEHIDDPKQVEQCFACVANPKTTYRGRTWCFACPSWCNTDYTRAKCNQCLTTEQDNYQGACACSSRRKLFKEVM